LRSVNFANYLCVLCELARLISRSIGGHYGETSDFCREHKALRASGVINQSEMANLLAISVSYLSQLEHDDRPLTPALIELLSRAISARLARDVEEDATTRRLAALREAQCDPLFPANRLSVDQLARIAEQQPLAGRSVCALHEAYRRSGQRLQIVDEALASEMRAEVVCRGKRCATGSIWRETMSTGLTVRPKNWRRN
jgi:transcriptional regulator with XRE-family HTH domain